LTPDQIAPEIHGHNGEYIMYINGEELEHLNSLDFQSGNHNLRIEFYAEHENSISMNADSPANPGCFTFLEAEFIVEEDPNIPTLSQWFLIYLGLLLLIFGVIQIKRTKTDIETILS